MTVQVNVSLEKDDAVNLDQMANDAGYDNRSAFVRLLIRREWQRIIQSAERKHLLSGNIPTILSDASISEEEQP